MITVDNLSISEQDKIIDSINLLIEISHNNAIDKGFVDLDKPRYPAELIALMHSELSELLEWFRTGNAPSDKIPRFSGTEEELADLLIRIFDTAGEYKLDLANALLAKSLYNRSRPPRHGKAF